MTFCQADCPVILAAQLLFVFFVLREEFAFLFQTFSRSDPPGKAPLTRGRYVFQKGKKGGKKRKDLLSDADPTDLRKSDFEIRGCALGRGIPVVCDMCMGSALHSDGTPYAGASTVDGATIDRLTHRKRVTEYPDLATSLANRVFGPRVRRRRAMGP